MQKIYYINLNISNKIITIKNNENKYNYINIYMCINKYIYYIFHILKYFIFTSKIMSLKSIKI